MFSQDSPCCEGESQYSSKNEVIGFFNGILKWQGHLFNENKARYKMQIIRGVEF